MAKIYASGNYVIVDDGVKVYEYAKGHTLYTLVDDVFYIKEITQGQFKVSVADLDAGNITSDDSGYIYNVVRFTTFLRENTGFKTAPGGSGAEWGSITGTLSTQSDLQSALDAKQDDLVSGTNIKTINGNSVLGSGNLVVGGSSGRFGIADANGVYTYYNTLTSAMTAAISGQTIEMFADITETGAVEITLKNGVNINGNGHTYTLNNSGNSNAFKDNGVTVICEIYNIHITRTGGAVVSNTNNMCFSETSTSSVIKCSGVYMNNTNGVCGLSQGTFIGVNCISVGLYTWFNTGFIIDSYFENTTNTALFNFSGEARNCNGIATSSFGIYSQLSSSTLFNCYGKSVSNNGILNGGKIYNCIAISTSGSALSLTSGAEATMCIGISSSGQGVDGNGHLAFNCRFISSSNYAASAGSSAEHYDCIHESSSNIAVFGFVGLKLYRGVAYSKWNNSGGHAFSQWASGSGSVLNNIFLRVTNTGANCIHARDATTFNYSQNAYLGATTAVNANITQGLVNTEDNQGNLRL